MSLNQKQGQARRALETDGISEVLYGGGKGGGKSWFLSDYAILYAKKVIDLCKLTLGPFPYVIGFLGRQRGIDFNKTTLVTWKRAIDPGVYTINEHKRELTLFGGIVSYHFGGMDSEEAVQKFNSAEYGLVALDQAEEVERTGLSMLRATQGRAKLNGIMLPKKMLLTANPAECPLEQDFFGDNVPAHRKFIQALASDNDALSEQERKDYIASLEEAYKYFPDLADAYIRGIWGSVKGGRYVIDRQTCDALKRLYLPELSTDRTVVSIDPAWLSEAGDEYVIYTVCGSRKIDAHYGFNQNSKVIAAEAMKRAKAFNAGSIITSTIGVGAGVYDEIVSQSKYHVIGFNEAERSEDDGGPYKYMNKRAEMYISATNALKANRFIFPSDDSELQRELCGIKYEIKNGCIKIEAKEDIRKRLGKSPGRADAYVQALWALETKQVRKSEPREKPLYGYLGRQVAPTPKRFIY